MKNKTQIIVTVKRKIFQLGVIIISWILFGCILTIYDYLVITSQYSDGPSTDYSFVIALAMNTGSAIIGGLLGGGLLVFYVNPGFRDKPYAYTIFAVVTSYFIIIALIIVILGVVFTPIRTGKPLSDPVTRAALDKFLFDSSRIKNTLSWSFIVALTQLFLQLNSKFGYGVFWNIIWGKYNTPKEENRIFMFLDINSSTSIAERLGNERYHELLKDFFADITNPIEENKGEIYQYVGDEVVIVWKYTDGLENNRCINCFFDMKRHIEKKKDKYLKAYGTVPAFKAGIHKGKVIAGEIGIIKRDITYSGDVLNTTSRIQSKCRELGVEILASSELLSALSLTKKYITRSLGSIKLRGKEKEIKLNTLIPV